MRNSYENPETQSFIKYFSMIIRQMKENTDIFFFTSLGHPPFFFFFLRLPSNAFPDIGSVGRIEKKKPKKIISILGIGALVSQHNSCGARKTTRHEPKINMAEKLVKVVAKLRQRGEKDQLPKLLCYIKCLKNVVRFFFCFVFFFVLKMPKIWVGRTTRNGEKKGDGLIETDFLHTLSYFLPANHNARLTTPTNESKFVYCHSHTIDQ